MRILIVLLLCVFYSIFISLQCWFDFRPIRKRNKQTIRQNNNWLAIENEWREKRVYPELNAAKQDWASLVEQNINNNNNKNFLGQFKLTEIKKENKNNNEQLTVCSYQEDND